jgi:hypothetical protein
MQDDTALQLELPDPLFEDLLTAALLVYDDVVRGEKLFERQGVADLRMLFSDDAGEGMIEEVLGYDVRADEVWKIADRQIDFAAFRARPPDPRGTSAGIAGSPREPWCGCVGGSAG